MSEPEQFGDEFLNLRYMIRARRTGDGPDLKIRVIMLRGDDLELAGEDAAQLLERLTAPPGPGPLPSVGESLDPATGLPLRRVRKHVPGA